MSNMLRQNAQRISTSSIAVFVRASNRQTTGLIINKHEVQMPYTNVFKDGRTRILRHPYVNRENCIDLMEYIVYDAEHYENFVVPFTRVELNEINNNIRMRQIYNLVDKIYRKNKKILIITDDISNFINEHNNFISISSIDIIKAFRDAHGKTTAIFNQLN